MLHQAPWTIGQTIRRQEIHDRFGGNRQTGISTPKDTPYVFLFTSPKSASTYGYDRYEGPQVDGSFSYTGEGTRGDQSFQRGNMAILRSECEGKTLELFRSHSPHATYIGSFTLGEPAYRYEKILDTDGHQRNGIVFNLVPLAADIRQSLPRQNSNNSKPTTADWYPPQYTTYEVSSQLHAGRQISRIEFELQADFGRWLQNQGELVQALRLPLTASELMPDIYSPSQRLILEAKKSSGRNYVREAIGQVLDYHHQAALHGYDLTPAILLPGLPETDLIDLIHQLGITLYVRKGEHGFVAHPAE
jgi:hypothetical protein